MVTNDPTKDLHEYQLSEVDISHERPAATKDCAKGALSLVVQADRGAKLVLAFAEGNYFLHG